MDSVPRPWRRFSDEEMVALARATVRWTYVPATGLLLVLLVVTLVWFSYGVAWWPPLATLGALGGLALTWRFSARAAGRSRGAAVTVTVVLGLVALLAGAATAATTTYVGVPLLLGLVPVAWAFVSRPGDDQRVRAAALSTATGAVGGLVSLPVVLAVQWVWRQDSDHISASVAFLGVLAAVQLVLHGLVRVSPAVATPVLVLNTAIGLVVTAVAFTIQNVGLGDFWVLYVVVGVCMGLTGLVLALIGRLRRYRPRLAAW